MLHRSRGSDPWFPTRNIYFMWAFIPPLLMALDFELNEALVWGIGYFIWATPGWMRWASLGHKTPAWDSDRPLTWDEKFIEFFCHGNYTFGLILRGFIWIIPLLIAMPFVGLNPIVLGIITFTFPFAYGFGWRFGGIRVIPIAEVLIGASWGLAMALS